MSFSRGSPNLDQPGRRIAVKTKLTRGQRVIRDYCKALEAKLFRLRNKVRLVTSEPVTGRNLTALRNTAAEVDELLYEIRLPRCMVCGCTHDEPCEDGCEWVRQGLCSACVEE
jgi:hypothetical protein